MKKLSPVLQFLAIASLTVVLFGCKSEEEKSNEEALKSRNSQASQMNTHGGSEQSVPKGSPGAPAAGK